MSAPALETRVIRLADGRDLSWIEAGAPAGAPVFVFHGAPGSGQEFAVHDAVAGRAGVRLIAPDRPGYGHSSYQPGRRLVDWPDDVAQLADHLQLDRFAVAGHSSGGPHALACARLLPDRVLGCAVISGPAPPGHPGMTDGMMLPNRMSWAVYGRWPPVLDVVAAGLWLLLRPLTALVLARARRRPEWSLRRMASVLPASDVAVVSRPEVREVLLAELAGFTPAVARASAQDMATAIRDWGFRLEEIAVPVHLWHGDADRNVPKVHGDIQARLIPGAVLHDCPGEGHWLVVDHMEEILRVLTR